MVIIEWRNKNNIFPIIENLKREYKNQFKLVDLDFDSNNNRLQSREFKNEYCRKVFWGDNFKVSCYLLNFFEEKIDLIYIDPPFFSGTDYEIQVRTDNIEYETIAYNDIWEKDFDNYLQMLYERFILFKKLLSKKGLLFVHLDWHASHYVKLILDEIFGVERFVNNIIWYYYNKYSAGKKNLPRAHDDILVYSKTNDYILNDLRILRDKPRKQLKRENINGVLKNMKDENGKVIYRIVKDKKLDDVWRIPCLQPASKEWTGFPNQKHHDLIDRIIKLGSNEGDLVADFFCGSGTTLLSAEKLKREWIGCDISEYSLHLTLDRLRKLFKNKLMNFNPLEFYTENIKENNQLLRSGFFDKEIKIRRKK